MKTTKIKVTIPTDLSDITIREYQQYIKLTERKDLNDHEFARRILAIFTTLKYHQTGDLKQSDYERLIDKILKALTAQHPFENTFELKGTRFGFIPNLDHMSAAEYGDLTNYGDDPENLHRVMAILFRPIVEERGDTYSIEPYQGTGQWAETMRFMPLHLMKGATGFFLSLRTDLLASFRASLAEDQTKRKRTVSGVSGDSMHPSQKLRGILSILINGSRGQYLKS